MQECLSSFFFCHTHTHTCTEIPLPLEFQIPENFFCLCSVVAMLLKMMLRELIYFLLYLPVSHYGVINAIMNMKPKPVSWLNCCLARQMTQEHVIVSRHWF